MMTVTKLRDFCDWYIRQCKNQHSGSPNDPVVFGLKDGIRVDQAYSTNIKGKQCLVLCNNGESG